VRPPTLRSEENLILGSNLKVKRRLLFKFQGLKLELDRKSALLSIFDPCPHHDCRFLYLLYNYMQEIRCLTEWLTEYSQARKSGHMSGTRIGTTSLGKSLQSELNCMEHWLSSQDLLWLIDAQSTCERGFETIRLGLLLCLHSQEPRQNESFLHRDSFSSR